MNFSTERKITLTTILGRLGRQTFFNEIAQKRVEKKDYLNGAETGVKKPKSNVPALFDKLEFT